MKESWRNIHDLIVRPGVTFTRLKYQPKWVLAFVIYFFLSVGLLWLIKPFTNQLILEQMLREAPGVASESTRVTSFGAYLFRGCVVLILWSVLLSAALLLVARVFKVGQALKFKHIYTGVVHFSVISTLVYFVNAGMLPIFRQVEDMKETIDLKIIPGMHLLAGSIENPGVLTFLSHVNPLSTWYVIVITVAVSTMAEINRAKALIVALIIWLLRVGAEIAFLAASLD